jgi:hypothetical protein
MLHSQPSIITTPMQTTMTPIYQAILTNYFTGILLDNLPLGVAKPRDNKIKMATHYLRVCEAVELLPPDLGAQLLASPEGKHTHLLFNKALVLTTYAACCQELFGQDHVPLRTRAFFTELLDASFLLTDNLAYDLSLVPTGQDLRVFAPKEGRSVLVPKAAITRWRNALLGTARCRADRLKWQLDIDMI